MSASSRVAACGLLAGTLTMTSGAIPDHAMASPTTAATQLELAPPSLKYQRVVVGPDEPLEFELIVANPAIARTADVAVAARPVAPGASAAMIRAALADPPPELDRVAVEPQHRAVTGTDLRISVDTEANDQLPNRLSLPSPGAYVVDLEFTTATATATVRTVVVRTVGPAASAEPLPLAVVVPVDGPLTLQPDGTTSIDPSVRSRVGALAALLGQIDAPLTVSVSPGLLDGLERSGVPGDAELVLGLASAIDRDVVLSLPYVHMDPSAVSSADLDAEFIEQLRVGEDVLTRLLSRSPDRRTWVSLDPISPAGLALMRDLGARAIVGLAGSGSDPTPESPAVATATTVARGTDLGAIHWFEPDHELSVSLQPDVDRGSDGGDTDAGRSDRIADAYRSLAATYAEVVAKRETGGAPLGIVVVLDVDHVDADKVAAFLAAAATDPLFPIRSPDDIGGAIASPIPGGGEPIADQSGAAGERTVLLRLATATASMLPADDPRQAMWIELADALLDSRLTAEVREEYETALRNAVLAVHHGIRAVPPSSVNLGDRTSVIPITLENSSTVPITVEVRLTSAKLRFPTTSVVTVPAAGVSHLRIPVEARTNGRFPVEVAIVTPLGGEPIGAPVTFSVRAGRLTGMGLFLTFAAVLILLTWWVHTVRRKRRRSHPEAMVGSAV
jgi:hypothetical protein